MLPYTGSDRISVNCTWSVILSPISTPVGEEYRLWQCWVEAGSPLLLSAVRVLYAYPYPCIDDHIYYHEATSPDSIMADFDLAWSGGDGEAYLTDILHTGDRTAIDGSNPRPFRFHFNSHNDVYPEFIELAEESTFIERSLGGVGWDPYSAVSGFSLDLDPIDEWETPEELEILGDPAPPGLLRRLYIVSSHWLGYPVVAYGRFYLIPTVGEGGEQLGYRIWKWEETSGIRNTTLSWSRVRYLYLN